MREALTPDRAAVPLSICPSERQREREGGLTHDEKRRMKEREEEMEKSLVVVVGGRQVPRGYTGETEG